MHKRNETPHEFYLWTRFMSLFFFFFSPHYYDYRSKKTKLNAAAAVLCVSYYGQLEVTRDELLALSEQGSGLANVMGKHNTDEIKKKLRSNGNLFTLSVAKVYDHRVQFTVEPPSQPAPAAS